MTDVDDIAESADGRVARRQRNIDAVLDVVGRQRTQPRPCSASD